MRQYHFMESKAGRIGFGIFLFLMLLLARDTLVTSCIIGFNKSQFLMLGVLCLLGIAFMIRNRREWKTIFTDNRMVLILLFCATLLVPMLVKRDWQMMYFSILLCPVAAVFLTYFTNYRQTAKYYVGILTVLAIYSLFATYVLKGMTHDGKLPVPVFYNSSGWDFYNYGLAYVVTWEAWHRNFGIFREPGVYQFFLLLAMYLNNYAVQWRKKWTVWVVNLSLAVAMVSTFAVGGYIEMALLAVFLYFDKKWYRERWGKILGTGAVVLGAAAVGFIMVQTRLPGFGKSIFYDFYDMFLRLTTKSNSLVDRLSAIFTNLELFLRNPLAGDKIASVLHGTNHNTSSTLILYAVLGFVGGTLNVISWAALTWKKERNIIGNLLLLVILFMSFNTQNLVADLFFWLFPVMALAERGLPQIHIPIRKKV